MNLVPSLIKEKIKKSVVEWAEKEEDPVIEVAEIKGPVINFLVEIIRSQTLATDRLEKRVIALEEFRDMTLKTMESEFKQEAKSRAKTVKKKKRASITAGTLKKARAISKDVHPASSH